MNTAHERARAIACAFALKPEHKDRLAKAIENAIMATVREAQAWRPIEVTDQNGNIASLQLHCDADGTKLIAFNPLLGKHFEFQFIPVVRKPVQRSEVLKNKQAAVVGG
jgi:hypothetical protein